MMKNAALFVVLCVITGSMPAWCGLTMPNGHTVAGYVSPEDPGYFLTSEFPISGSVSDPVWGLAASSAGDYSVSALTELDGLAIAESVYVFTAGHPLLTLSWTGSLRSHTGGGSRVEYSLIDLTAEQLIDDRSWSLDFDGGPGDWSAYPDWGFGRDWDLSATYSLTVDHEYSIYLKALCILESSATLSIGMTTASAAPPTPVPLPGTILLLGIGTGLTRRLRKS